MDPLSFNALTSIAVVVFFLVQGALYYRDIRDERTFFLYDKKLPSGEYAFSFAAASTSLATVLFFFVTLGITFGVYILFAPLTYLVGTLFYVKVILPKLQQQGFFSLSANSNSPAFVTAGDTLGKYLADRFKSKTVKVCVLLVTFLGMISILLIELFVGVNIFSIYLDPQYVDLALILISFVVFAYTGLGGLPAVVKTDKTQFKLMLIASCAFLLWLLWICFDKQVFPSIQDFFTPLPPLSEGLFLPYPLFFNILIVNLLLIPALLRTWQMAAASPSVDEVRNGIMRGAYITVLLTAVFILIGIFFFRVAFPNAQLSLAGILNTLIQNDNFVGRYIIFPSFFAACLAALLSTADSALIPVLQSILRDFDVGTDQTTWKRSRVLLLTFLILVLAVGLYFLVFRLLGFNLISWLFTIFSFLIIASPSVIFAVLAPNDLVSTTPSKILAVVSIFLGLVVASSLSYIGNQSGSLTLIQLNSPLGALAGSIPLAALSIYHALRTRRRQ